MFKRETNGTNEVEGYSVDVCAEIEPKVKDPYPSNWMCPFILTMTDGARVTTSFVRHTRVVTVLIPSL